MTIDPTFGPHGARSGAASGPNPYLATIAALLLIIVVIFGSLWFLAARVAERAAYSDAANLAQTLSTFRSVYTTEVVAPLVDQGLSAIHDYHGKPGVLPLPATMTLLIGQQISGDNRQDTTVKLYSPYPFPWRVDEGGLRDDFAHAAWDALNNSGLDSYFRVEHQQDGSSLARFALADRMNDSCISCHNTHPDTPRRDWTAGQLRGVLEVSRPVGGLLKSARSEFQTSAIAIFIAIALIAGLLILYIRKNHLYQKKMASDFLQLRKRNNDIENISFALSHTLKTPVRGISGLADIIEEDLTNAPDQVLDNLASIKERTTYLWNRLDSLNEYLKADQSAAASSTVDFNEFINSLCKQNNVPSRFRIELPPESPKIMINPGFLGSVLSVLINNAVDHHDRERGTIRVLATDAGAEYRISVSDDGPGINAMFRERVFEIFETLDTSSFGNRGLGLTICRKIIEANGGQIWLESEPGAGTTVYFSVPKNR